MHKFTIHPITKFSFLILFQIIIAFLPILISFGILLIVGLLFSFYQKFRSIFWKFLAIYCLSILFFIPLVWIEMRFFQYDFSNVVFLLSLYIKSFLSLCCIIFYKQNTSLLEFFYVLERLHIPPLFLLATLFILLFLRNILGKLQSMKTIWTLRVHTPRFFFRFKIFFSLLQNLIVFSFHNLEDMHSMVLLRKLNRPIPFAMLYNLEKKHRKKNQK